MQIQTYSLAAPLAYAGGSFRSVKLAPPFKIERWSYEKICELIIDMEGPTDWSPDHRVDELHCVPEYGTTGHVITAQVELDYDDSVDSILALHKALEAKDELLDRQIRLISLYLSAPILIAAKYWFQMENEERIMTSSTQQVVPYDSHSYGISYQEAQGLNAFLSRETPRNQPDFISIALDHWGHSYESIPLHMQLVSLVTALEVLLNPAQTELKHRVTRLAAVLLGTSKEDSQDIYMGLGKIYDARSKVVHTGRLAAAKDVWYWQLRRWVSRAILYAIALKRPKDQLCRDLNQLGFGDGPHYILNAEKMGRSIKFEVHG
jgi:hypothetical protein